jgi:hypothetical protein
MHAGARRQREDERTLSVRAPAYGGVCAHDAGLDLTLAVVNTGSETLPSLGGESAFKWPLWADVPKGRAPAGSRCHGVASASGEADPSLRRAVRIHRAVRFPVGAIHVLAVVSIMFGAQKRSFSSWLTQRSVGGRLPNVEPEMKEAANRGGLQLCELLWKDELRREAAPGPSPGQTGRADCPGPARRQR